MENGRVVIVGRSETDTAPLHEVLVAEGWDVHECPGPASTRCPLLVGENCEVRGRADVMITYLDPRQRPATNLVKIRCAASSPAVVVLEGQVDPPRREGKFMLIGSLRGPREIVELLRDLNASEPAAPIGGKII